MKLDQYYPDHDPEFSQKRASYRSLLFTVLHAIRSQRGDEEGLNQLITVLSRLEQWMVQTFGDSEQKKLGNERERRVSQVLDNKKAPGMGVEDYLIMTQRRLERLVQGELTPAEIARQLNILYVHLPHPILRPVPGNNPIQAGSGRGVEVAAYTPRLQRLLGLLRKNGIYSDDLAILDGILLTNQMRTRSYALVEIPRIGKAVLVCNEIGEATFVSQQLLQRASYGKTKEELQAIEGVEKINFTTWEEWDRRITELLLNPDSQPAEPITVQGAVRKKVDVRDKERVTNLLLGKYPSSQDWIKLPTKNKRAYIIEEFSVSDLARIFGLKGHPRDKLHDWLQLGACIYGADDAGIQQVLEEEKKRFSAEVEYSHHPQKLCAMIRGEMSAKEWMSKKTRDRWGVRLTTEQWDLTHLARILGVTGNIHQVNLPYYELAAKIFGEENPEIHDRLMRERAMEHQNLQDKDKQRELGDDVEKWKCAIRAQISVEQWIGLSCEERRGIFVHGLGIIRLARILGVRGNPLRWTLDHLELGAQIYGEHDSVLFPLLRQERKKQEQVDQIALAKQKELGKDPEKWRAEILLRTPLEAWMALDSQSKRRAYSLHGLGLRALSGIFQISSKYGPVSSVRAYLELGIKIYGPNQSLQKIVEKKEHQDQSPDRKKQKEFGGDPDKWKQEIRNMFNADTWLAISAKERRTFKVHGYALYRIATIFGIADDPVAHKQGYLNLGRRIFGEQAIADALKRADLRE